MQSQVVGSGPGPDHGQRRHGQGLHGKDRQGAGREGPAVGRALQGRDLGPR
ncbi:MAG: hypothetical protein V4466_01395 [Pseudomonadota bacterium]